MKILLDEDGIRRSITRISYEIIERNKTVDNIVLVGIKSRGDILAERIKQKLKELENIDVPLETIDITYYRDDIDRKNFELDIKDIEFTGRINVKEYIGKMDITILTSISEGQPLTILESYAAHVPVIATDVGNCRGLIYGENDGIGSAGILTHIMNVEEITRAILRFASDSKMREEYGNNGYKRFKAKYTIEHMKNTYDNIYKELLK